ncbi:hypothetical protein ACSBR1_001293 [Camellia fascicularis]
MPHNEYFETMRPAPTSKDYVQLQNYLILENLTLPIWDDSTHHNSPKLYLNTTESHIEITDIFLSGELHILGWIGYDCFSEGVVNENYSNPSITLCKFPISNTRNRFTVVGCDTYAVIKGSWGRKYATGCLSLCDRIDNVINGSCSGIGYCQTSIPKGVKSFEIGVSSYDNHTFVWGFNPCSYAFVAKETTYRWDRGSRPRPSSNHTKQKNIHPHPRRHNF